MYLPDLFGAAIKGRQQAIQDNWTDLNNFENVDAARYRNDASALQNWLALQKAPGDLSMHDDQVLQSNLARQVLETAAPGQLAKAMIGSDFVGGQAKVYFDPVNHQLMLQNMNNGYYQKQRQAANAATALAGQNDALQSQAYQVGNWNGLGAVNKAQANYITTTTLPQQATQNGTNALLGGKLTQGQLEGGIQAQPFVNQTTLQNAKNNLWTAQQFIKNTESNNQLTVEQRQHAARDYISGQLGLLRTNVSDEQKAQILDNIAHTRQFYKITEPIAPTTTSTTTTTTVSNVANPMVGTTPGSDINPRDGYTAQATQAAQAMADSTNNMFSPDYGKDFSYNGGSTQGAGFGYNAPNQGAGFSYNGVQPVVQITTPSGDTTVKTLNSGTYDEADGSYTSNPYNMFGSDYGAGFHY